MLVAVADRTGKQPQQGLLDHFNKLMDSPCTNHAYPIKHFYKNHELLKRFLRQADGPKGDIKEAIAKKGGATNKDSSGLGKLSSSLPAVPPFLVVASLSSPSFAVLAYRRKCLRSSQSLKRRLME